MGKGITNAGDKGGFAYSTSVEVKTGDKWFDGRPVYCMTYYKASGTFATGARVELGSLPANIKQLLKATGAYYASSSNYWQSLPVASYYQASYNVELIVGPSSVAVTPASGHNNENYTDITIQIFYTKTTD